MGIVDYWHSSPYTCLLLMVMKILINKVKDIQLAEFRYDW